MFVSSQKDFCREDKKVQMAHYVVIYYKNIYLYELRVWVPVIRVEFCYVNKSRLLASWILSEFKRNLLIIYVRLYLVLFLENSSPSGKKKKKKRNRTKPKNRTSDIGSGNVTCMVIVSSTLTLLHHQPEGM